jgi:CheY-like chemotaxis protein
MRVLVVEDNRLNQKVAVHSLKKCGCTVDLAENGLIATQLIEQTISGSLLPYDVIFMDVMMPVMDGTTATKRIRELERGAPPSYKRNLVIALSANVGPEHVISVKDAGCDGSLGKPFYPSTLRKVLYDVFANEYVGFDGGSKTPSIGTRPGM